MSLFQWTDAEVRAALDLTPRPETEDLTYERISTDSRRVGEGDLFVALVGDTFDGHDFVADAIAGGARGAVVARQTAGIEDTVVYPVDDTLTALGDLAHHRGAFLDARVVGITGSTGKTTTKDLTRGALSATYRVHATEGNRNNRIGLPLTLLAAPDEAQVLVLEMGSNEPGEIGALCGLAEPDVGVITTVSEAHLEKLGSLNGVLEEKMALVRAVPAEGEVIVGDDPELLATAARNARSGALRVVGWTERADQDLRPQDPEIDEQGCFRFLWRGEKVSLRIPGRHAVQNALLALTVAEYLDVPPAKAASGIERVPASAMRGEVRSVGTVTLILDCYNANPQSVGAALELLETYPEAGSCIAVLGSMLELGDRSAALHREVLSDALSRPLDLVLATGLFAEAAESLGRQEGGEARAALMAVEDLDAAYSALRERMRGGETVLLKASRGVAMERLVPLFERDFGGQSESSGEGEA
jgi:UDP-N-acetylmuramoyl-tripeptide--D-alanyl-D-alanine ligase